MDAVKIYREAYSKAENNEITFDDFIDLILPLEDVRENKHGEWKHNKNNGVIKCSVCGFGIMDSTFVWQIRSCCGTIENNPFNFCPNCGANMRGETDEAKA